MKFSMISGVAVVALALATVGALAQTTGSSTLTPPPAGYNNSTVGPASADKSQSSQYSQSGVQPPPAGYNNSTIGPAGADKSKSGQYSTTPSKSQ
jgi:hypothetical protein